MDMSAYMTPSAYDAKVMADLMRVRGIGEKSALELLKNGYTKPSELVSIPTISMRIRLAAKFVDDIDTRIPNKIVKTEVGKVKQTVKRMHGWHSKIEVIGVGSFRRNMPSSGDIDVLLVLPDEHFGGESKSKIVETFTHDLLTGKNVVIVGEKRLVTQDGEEISIDDVTKDYVFIHSSGDSVANVLGQFNEDKMTMLELYFCTESRKGAALLHYTGSKTFNIIMSKKAKAMNMMLTSDGLYSIEGGGSRELLDSSTEEIILKTLGYRHIPPEMRSDGDNAALRDAIKAHKLSTV